MKQFYVPTKFFSSISSKNRNIFEKKHKNVTNSKLKKRRKKCAKIDKNNNN